MRMPGRQCCHAAKGQRLCCGAQEKLIEIGFFLEPVMIDPSRMRAIFLGAFALYLATSVAQLNARQVSWHTPSGMSLATIGAALEWHMMQIAKAEQNENYVYAPGN
jgi:hypothetical protein